MQTGLRFSGVYGNGGGGKTRTSRPAPGTESGNLFGRAACGR